MCDVTFKHPKRMSILMYNQENAQNIKALDLAQASYFDCIDSCSSPSSSLLSIL